MLGKEMGYEISICQCNMMEITRKRIKRSMFHILWRERSSKMSKVSQIICDVARFATGNFYLYEVWVILFWGCPSVCNIFVSAQYLVWWILTKLCICIDTNNTKLGIVKHSFSSIHCWVMDFRSRISFPINILRIKEWIVTKICICIDTDNIKLGIIFLSIHYKNEAKNLFQINIWRPKKWILTKFGISIF